MSAHEYHFPHNGISLGFEFKLKRRSTYVTHLFLAPSIICGLLTPFLFILPHGEDANLTLGALLFIVHLLMLIDLESVVPHAYPRIPNIAIFSFANLALMVTAVALTVFNDYLWNRQKTRGAVPRIICVVFLGILGNLFGIKKDDFLPKRPAQTNVTQEEENEQVDKVKVLQEYNQMATKAEWSQLTVILDRLYFIIFLVAVIIATIVVQIH